jgi:hypothetical protein
MWKFLSSSKIIVQSTFWTPNLMRDGEVSLMENLVQHRDKFSRSNIMAINRCRVFLQVISLADVVSNDGKFVLKAFYFGTAAPARNHLCWPRQMKPIKKDWEQW